MTEIAQKIPPFTYITFEVVAQVHSTWAYQITWSLSHASSSKHQLDTVKNWLNCMLQMRLRMVVGLGLSTCGELKPDDHESGYYENNFMYFNWNFTLIWGNRRLALYAPVSPKVFYRSINGHSHFHLDSKNAQTKLSWNPLSPSQLLPIPHRHCHPPPITTTRSVAP